VDGGVSPETASLRRGRRECPRRRLRHLQ
jgi:hypothetical protein